MRKFFSQFGNVKKIRLSRNSKTGASRHYAFIEFESPEVAEIVADTMDKYILFGHSLSCNVMMEDQVHPDIWKGMKRRFIVKKQTVPKRTPRTLEQVRLSLEHRIENNQNILSKLEEMGIQYDYLKKAIKEDQDVLELFGNGKEDLLDLSEIDNVVEETKEEGTDKTKEKEEEKTPEKEEEKTPEKEEEKTSEKEEEKTPEKEEIKTEKEEIKTEEVPKKTKKAKKEEKLEGQEVPKKIKKTKKQEKKPEEETPMKSKQQKEDKPKKAKKETTTKKETPVVKRLSQKAKKDTK